MKRKYKVIKKNEDKNLSVIEVANLTTTLTLNDIENNLVKGEKIEKELEAQLLLEEAKMSNFESYHPFVKEMNDQDLSTAQLYYEAKQLATKLKPKIVEVKKALQEERDQKEIILKLLEDE